MQTCEKCGSEIDRCSCSKQANLMEGEDFYYDDGAFVFTEKYLKERGFCCKNGCRHCPY